MRRRKIILSVKELPLEFVENETLFFRKEVMGCMAVIWS